MTRGGTPPKRSIIVEASLVGGVERVDIAVEAGPLAAELSSSGALVPEPHGAEIPDEGAREALLDTAGRLVDDLAGRIGFGRTRLGVRLREARVFEAGRRRRIVTAQILVGLEPGSALPRWTRVVGLEPGSREWPAALLDAAERCAVELGSPGVSGPTPAGSGDIVIDAFAVADLLRVQLPRWERSAEAGERVAAASVDVLEGGDPFDAGVAEPGRKIVDGGRLVNDAADGRPLLRGSWRESLREGRHALVLDAPRVAADRWRGASHVVTRVLLFGGDLWWAGLAMRDGQPTGRFGPEPSPSDQGLFDRIAGRTGDALWDLGGLPVKTAALLAGPIFPSR